MSKLEIIETAVLAVAVLVILVYCIVAICKNHWVSQIVETVDKACGEAETKFPEHGSGEQKKAYVIAAVKAKCKELKIPYELLSVLVSKLIEKAVASYNAISGK